MTPSKRAKSLGVKSLATLSEKTGIPERTLKDWNYKKTETFDKLCGLVRKSEEFDGMVGWNVNEHDPLYNTQQEG